MNKHSILDCKTTLSAWSIQESTLLHAAYVFPEATPSPTRSLCPSTPNPPNLQLNPICHSPPCKPPPQNAFPHRSRPSFVRPPSFPSRHAHAPSAHLKSAARWRHPGSWRRSWRSSRSRCASRSWGGQPWCCRPQVGQRWSKGWPGDAAGEENGPFE